MKATFCEGGMDFRAVCFATCASGQALGTYADARTPIVYDMAAGQLHEGC
jgi:hypothetical protein